MWQLRASVPWKARYDVGSLYIKSSGTLKTPSAEFATSSYKLYSSLAHFSKQTIHPATCFCDHLHHSGVRLTDNEFMFCSAAGPVFTLATFAVGNGKRRSKRPVAIYWTKYRYLSIRTNHEINVQPSASWQLVTETAIHWFHNQLQASNLNRGTPRLVAKYFGCCSFLIRSLEF